MVTKASHKTGLIKTALITSDQFRGPDDRGHFYTIYPSPLHGVFKSSMKVLVKNIKSKPADFFFTTKYR